MTGGKEKKTMKRTKTTFRTWTRKNGKVQLVNVTGWRLYIEDFSVLVYHVYDGSKHYHVISPKHGLSVGIAYSLKECEEIAKKYKDYIKGVKPVKLPCYWGDPGNE